MNPYVIKKWQVNENVSDPKETVIQIEGRAGGFLSWLLSLLKISPTVSLEITGEQIRFSEGSLAGTANRLIPLSSVCSTYYGYVKPWKEALALGIILAVPTFGIGIILAILYYYLNKHMAVGFIEVSGVANGIAFKRSVIEGIKVDEDSARQVAELAEKLIKAQR